MPRALKIGTLAVLSSTIVFAIGSQAGAQANALSDAQTKRDESAATTSLLVPSSTPSPATATPAIAADTHRPTQKSAGNVAEALPPPRNPGRAATAGPSNRLARRQPFMRPTGPDPADPNAIPLAEPATTGEVIPAPAGSEVTVRPTPPISVDTDRHARRMYRSSGEVELRMMVKNPADGCVYEIPLCIPACCTGEPTMDEWCGLFGRGVVEYCWECGFRAKVVFRHVLGDVKVEYDGR
jgi:hypothetical protein